MSYILEALKKSQQERELGQIPTLATESPAELEPPSKTNPVVLSALILALLAIIVALYAVFGNHFFTPQEPPTNVEVVPAAPLRAPTPPLPDPAVALKPDRHSESTTVPQPDTVFSGDKEAPVTPRVKPPVQNLDQQGSQEKVVIVEIEQPAPAPKRTPLPEDPTDQSEPAPSAESNLRAAIDQPPPTPEQPSIAEEKVAQPVTARSSVKQELRQEFLDLQEQLLKKNAEGTEKTAQAKTREPVETTAPPQPHTAQDDKAQAAVKMPQQEAATPTTKPLAKSENDLPYDVYKRLPQRKVSALAYSNDPKRRFVLINSQKLKEGEGTKDGLMIEEILRHGIIFNFEGHRFFNSL